MEMMTKVRLFLASPGDLAEERKLVHRVVERLNSNLSSSTHLTLEVVDWATSISPGMGQPQKVIFDQIDIKSWDVFMGLLWLRFGSATGGSSSEDGKEFGSGTEEEFKLAYSMWKETGRPQIFIYRCTRVANPLALDAGQFVKVQRFFEEFSESGKHPGLVQQFDSVDSFEKRLEADLIRLILNVSKAAGQGAEASLRILVDSESIVIPRSLGYTGFFTPETNQIRNERKRQSLRSEKVRVRLLAHVGFSYLAPVGGRFRDEVISLLEDGGEFHAVILNPWTMGGLLIAVGEEGLFIGSLEEDPNVRDRTNVESMISKSKYYKHSLCPVLEEIQGLRETFGDRVNVRFTSDAIPASIMLTSASGFFEPYISVGLRQRLRRAFHTFEVQFTNLCTFYEYTSGYFDTLFGISESFESFLVSEPTHRVRFLERFKSKAG